MRFRLAALIVASLSLFGCDAPKHSNTLVFGTNTKVAFDVSADPTGAPSITLGYKRQEAVWMPLLANTDRGAATCKPEDKPPPADCAFVGNEGSDRDTYSVLASFGADFEGSANAQGQTAAAGAGLAQYFATGHAARILANRGGAALVNANAKSIDEQAATLRVAQLTAVDKVVAHVNTDGKVDVARLKKLIPESSGIDAAWADGFKDKPVAELRKELNGDYQNYVVRMAGNIKES